MIDEKEQALFLMGAWGSGESLDEEPFKDDEEREFGYVITDYCPEWLNHELPVEYRNHHGGVVTILHNAFGSGPEVKGYKVLEIYATGEHNCPYKDVNEEEEGVDHTDNCPMCGGDNVIYWGEEWQVTVLVPDMVQVKLLFAESYGDPDEGEWHTKVVTVPRYTTKNKSHDEVVAWVKENTDCIGPECLMVVPFVRLGL